MYSTRKWSTIISHGKEYLGDHFTERSSSLKQLPSNTNLKTGGRDQESPNSAFVASRLPAKNQPSCWLRSGPLAGDLEPHTSDVGLRAFLQCLYCNGGTVTLCCKDEWKLKIVWKSLVLYPSFPKSFKELSEKLGFGKWSQPLYAVWDLRVVFRGLYIFAVGFLCEWPGAH